MIRGQLWKPLHTWQRPIPFKHSTWQLTNTESETLKTENTNLQRYINPQTNEHQSKCNFNRKKKKKKKHKNMMNVLGLSLVVTSLAAASMFSPSPTQDNTQQQQKKQAASTIVKEGHRVVVVEYDQDGYHNTKISISPEQAPHHDKVTINVLDNAKDKIKEAASVLPNLGQGISQDPALMHAPTELLCDAYGKCKHKISDAIGKAKDMAQETLDKKKDETREVGKTVADAVSKAKETVYDKARDVQEYTKECVEKGKDTGQTVKEHIVGNVSEVVDSLWGVRDGVKRVASKFGSVETLESLMGVANLMGLATAYGMCVWITFISSYLLSRVMPRQQFAVVQSKIYPVYFRAMAYCIGIALLGHVLGHRKRLFSNKAEILQAYNLLASLLTVFANSVCLEPRATKLIFERMKIEKEEGRGREDITAERSRTEEHQRSADPRRSSTTAGAESSPTTTQGTEHDAVRSRIIKLNNKLKRLNSHSSFLNILNLMSLTWHLVYLAQRVHHSC